MQRIVGVADAPGHVGDGVRAPATREHGQSPKLHDREGRHQQLATKQIHIWRLDDDRVIEHWSVRDDLGQALRLGLFH
jgi:hypothetical protein